MSQAKKFGTFTGVFTPSFLSIIGVIMYLRLGWIVGEAGIFKALAIILLAHVISITTGFIIHARTLTSLLYYLPTILKHGAGFVLNIVFLYRIEL
jgi:hypothetical protein